jgi:hypothetical protein
MAGNFRETSKERAFGAPRGATLAGAGFDEPERGAPELVLRRHRARNPALREHRIKIREEGSSFTMIDSRRRCRVPAHWACRLAEEDIAKRSGLRVPGEGQGLRIFGTHRQGPARADAAEQGEILEILGAQDHAHARLRTIASR